MEKEKLVPLIIAVQNGNAQAADMFFSEIYNDVYYFALKTVKEAELAADITQETLIEVFNKINELREPAAFPAWCRQITYFKCTAYFRKRKDVLLSEDEEGGSLFDTIEEESAEFIPDAALDVKDFKGTVLQFINTLSEEQRSAVIMYYFDELSVGEIARIQGVSEGTVKSRLNYARKAIKELVEDYEKKSGIKLHAFGFMPFIKWLLIPDKAASLMPTAAVQSTAAAVSKAVGVSLSAAAAATAVTTVSTTASVGILAKIIALPIATKVIAGVVAAAILATSIGLAVALPNADYVSYDEDDSYYDDEDDDNDDNNDDNNDYYDDYNNGNADSNIDDVFGGSNVKVPETGTQSVAFSVTVEGDGVVIRPNEHINAETVTSLAIPATLNGLPVIRVEGDFSIFTSLRSIEVSAQVIEESAFEGLESLETVIIGKEVQEIKDRAFASTNVSQIVIYSDTAIIDAGAFVSTAFYDNDANWQDGFLILDDKILMAETNLSNYKIPEGITYVAKRAFTYEESNYTNGSVYISSTLVRGIQDMGAHRMVKIEVSPNHPLYYADNNIIVERSTKRLVYSGKNVGGGIPSDGSVTIIGKRAFADRYVALGMMYILLPDVVEIIEEEAFANNGIYFVGLPKSIKRIETRAFCGAEIRSFSLPSSVEYIGADAFKDCEIEGELVIPKTLNKLDVDENGNFKPVFSGNKFTSVTIEPGNPLFEGKNEAQIIKQLLGEN